MGSFDISVFFLYFDPMLLDEACDVTMAFLYIYSL